MVREERRLSHGLSNDAVNGPAGRRVGFAGLVR
jgi:hypothetical protein